ncbi:MAG: hypothetical protein LBR56_06305, partial [Sporomusaceae bacterium]|nr:hypothetical protein [Sporomusaceae bacterium]
MIDAKLQNMKNLDDRLALKNILLDVFFNLYEHSETAYSQLENRVFAETPHLQSIYDIYNSISPRAYLDPVHYFLRPIDKKDVSEKFIDLTNLLALAEYDTALKEPLFKIFLNCSYQTVQEIARQKFFKGAIITETETLDAVFTLKESKNYLDKAKKLYETFLDNNIPWKTLNNPYIFKIFDVSLIKCSPATSGEQTVQEAKIDLGQYNQYTCYDMVPLWNVEELKCKSVGFPMPCKDKINFEHTIYLESEGTEHGY